MSKEHRQGGPLGQLIPIIELLVDAILERGNQAKQEIF